MSVERSTVGSLLRSTQAYCGQLSDKETLDEGIAFYSEAFRDLPEANQFREVMIDDAQRIPTVFASVDRWFLERGLTCHRWAPAGGQRDAALSDHLSDRGFHALHYVALSLTRWVDLQPDPSIRVLPARAMRDAYRATFSGAQAPPSYYRDAARRCRGAAPRRPPNMTRALRSSTTRQPDVARFIKLVISPAS